MKIVVALLALTCTAVHGLPKGGDVTLMMTQGTTTASTPTPAPVTSVNSMSPESSNTMSAPNTADQGKQPMEQMPQQPPPPSPTMSQTPAMPQGTTEKAQNEPPAMGQGSVDAGSQGGSSNTPQEPNMYQMGMSNNG